MIDIETAHIGQRVLITTPNINPPGLVGTITTIDRGPHPLAFAVTLAGGTVLWVAPNHIDDAHLIDETRERLVI